MTTDQSAAEYDCADEAMDGPDSICVDDLILEQNRTRVLSMNIQKPIIKQGDVISSETNSPQKKDGAKRTQQAATINSSTLKRLLFGHNFEQQLPGQNSEPQG